MEHVAATQEKQLEPRQPMGQNWSDMGQKQRQAQPGAPRRPQLRADQQPRRVSFAPQPQYPPVNAHVLPTACQSTAAPQPAQKYSQ